MVYNFTDLKKQLSLTNEWLRKEFQQVRTGQASPAILDKVRVESFGAQMSLKEVASITIEGPKTLRIAPWDKGQIKEIEKAINAANLGISTVVDDQGLRAIFPQLTQESRLQMVKMVKEKLEEARKQIRHERENHLKELQNAEKSGGLGKDDIFRLKNEIQKVVDEENKTLDELTAKKEKEILG